VEYDAVVGRVLGSGPSATREDFSFVLGGDGFPLSDVPMQEIVEKAQRGAFAARPARAFAFDQIVEAHRVMESGEAGGKLVVTV
jgi:NADPH:quinone reductase-like Zn-dependent oxidoreductase